MELSTNRNLTGWRISLRRSTAAVALALAATVLLATSAEASFIDKQTSTARVSGSVTVFADRTAWNLSVTRIAGGRCVYAKVVIDRNNVPDSSYRSANACNGPIAFTRSTTLAGTRGAKVVLCQDVPWSSDPCTTVWYEPEA